MDKVQLHITLLRAKSLLLEAEIVLALVDNPAAMAIPVKVPTWGTAAARAMLMDETWATDKQWRRAEKRARQAMKK